MPRDYSAVMRDGRCVICGQPRRVPDAHMEIHLSRGEARTDTYRGVTSIVPMQSDKPVAPRLSWKRRLDPALAKLVRAEQRKQKASPRQ